MGWILGPTFAGEYPKDDPIKGRPSGCLRRNFALFANVRPVRGWPQLDPLIPISTAPFSARTRKAFSRIVTSPWGYGEFKPTEDVGPSLRVITAPACERFARLAFEYAATTNVDRLAVIHERTALPQPKASSSTRSNGCTPNTGAFSWSWSASIPSAPRSPAIPRPVHAAAERNRLIKCLGHVGDRGLCRWIRAAVSRAIGGGLAPQRCDASESEAERG